MGEAKNREAATAAAVQALRNTKEQQVLRLTPEQLCTLLVFEAQAAQLQTAANQLGGFLGLKAEAEVLLSAKGHLDAAKVRMQAEWQRTVQVAQPADVPRLVTP